MDESETTLPERDHLAILDVILAFNQCRNPRELNDTFRSQLLPLLEASSGLYAWTDPDISEVQITGTVNIPEPTVQAFQDYIPYDGLANQMVAEGRSVMAYDVDISPTRYSETVDRFFAENPKYRRREHPYFDRHKTALVALELPNPIVGFALHRLGRSSRKMTFRDVRVLELIRPHLLQTLKTILLSEELSKYRSLAEALANVPTPIALLTTDFRVVYGNDTFAKTFKTTVGRRLPDELATVLRRKISKEISQTIVVDSSPRIPFCQIGQDVFRLSMSRLESKALDERTLWLLRLKPAVEPYAKVNKLMQDKGLTTREIEVCALVRVGIADKEISGRLFIAFDTVKSHLKHIHDKMHVHTRAELVALLSQ